MFSATEYALQELGLWGAALNRAFCLLTVIPLILSCNPSDSAPVACSSTLAVGLLEYALVGADPNSQNQALMQKIVNTFDVKNVIDEGLQGNRRHCSATLSISDLAKRADAASGTKAFRVESLVAAWSGFDLDQRQLRYDVVVFDQTKAPGIEVLNVSSDQQHVYATFLKRLPSSLEK